MKKIIALVLSIVMICCFSVTAFAAESPTATEKVTVTLRKASSDVAVDKAYTVDAGATITVKADSKYGKFNGWSIYKEAAATPKTGMVTLSVLNLATTKTATAVEGTDYEIVSGSLTSTELTIKVKSSVIICGNYDGKTTDPSASSNADGSAQSPQTGDMTIVYAVVAMLALGAFAFGVKKVYSK